MKDLFMPIKKARAEEGDLMFRAGWKTIMNINRPHARWVPQLANLVFLSHQKFQPGPEKVSQLMFCQNRHFLLKCGFQQKAFSNKKNILLTNSQPDLLMMLYTTQSLERSMEKRICYWWGRHIKQCRHPAWKEFTSELWNIALYTSLYLMFYQSDVNFCCWQML